MSRALIGGMLDSKEKTAYEDWREDIAKKRHEKTDADMKLYDMANGYHKYNGEDYEFDGDLGKMEYNESKDVKSSNFKESLTQFVEDLL